MQLLRKWYNKIIYSENVKQLVLPVRTNAQDQLQRYYLFMYFQTLVEPVIIDNSTSFLAY